MIREDLHTWLRCQLYSAREKQASAYLGIRVESWFELQLLVSHLRKEFLHER